MDSAHGRNGIAGSATTSPGLRKAIILNAGQGRRLLPFTTEVPKCLLPVDSRRTILELQLSTLACCGIQRVAVIVGFGAEKIAHFLATRPGVSLEITTRYNPFFKVSNNLISCWTAIPEMTEDFLLLNGDTLFEPAVLRRVLSAPVAPVTLAIDRKREYDEDDMKVSLNSGRQLRAVGKSLDPASVHGESIGLMTFRDAGVTAFRTMLGEAIHDPASLTQWYLAVIDTMARSSLVDVVSIEGLWWTEIDTPDDLARARAYFDRERARQEQVGQLPGSG
ncbi:MAG: phosphocholine cytidylyltransferase family protein [Thermodesulfobacteriota bacterium]|jgi:choline kinase